jgi:3-deoxy-manno-octulosonate cytidylyltransferase (CMP-KDO synthetase)
MAQVTAIIPARLESRRFSRKVLYPLKGKPLIFYVWKAARDARMIDRLFVATDSAEIGQAVNDFGGSVVMTSSRPRNGTERVAEAVSDMNSNIVLNIQADNLGLTGSILDRIINSMAADRQIAYATLAQTIDGRDWKQKLYNPNVVKVIGDRCGNAAWFSRYPIPYVKRPGRKRAVDMYPFLEHIGVYFFRKKALTEYVNYPRGQAEKAESLEQLRILENGNKIKLYKTRAKIISVDNKKDLRYF